MIYSFLILDNFTSFFHDVSAIIKYNDDSSLCGDVPSVAVFRISSLGLLLIAFR